MQLFVAIGAEPLVTLGAMCGDLHSASPTIAFIAMFYLNRHSILFLLLATFLGLALLGIVKVSSIVLSTFTLLVDLFVALATHPQSTFITMCSDLHFLSFALTLLTLGNIVWQRASL